MDEETVLLEKDRRCGAFNTTHWSVVLAAGGEDSSGVQDALERLCSAYWYPLYAYVRRQGHSHEDAQDLVQGFFERMLGRKYLGLADRGRGRFRTFLLSSLQHFLINEWQKSYREKRGSGRQIESLDELSAESRFAAEPATSEPPDMLYDRGWAATVLQRALSLLRAEYSDLAKAVLFERLKVFVWGEKNAVSYATVAAELKLSEGALKVAIHRLRQRYGELVRAEIAQTVATPVEARDELRYLVAVIRHGQPGST